MQLPIETGPLEFPTGSRMELTVKTDDLKHDSESEKARGVGGQSSFSQGKEYAPQKEPTCDRNDRTQAHTTPEELGTVNKPAPRRSAPMPEGCRSSPEEACNVHRTREGRTNQLSKEVIVV